MVSKALCVITRRKFLWLQAMNSGLNTPSSSCRSVLFFPESTDIAHIWIIANVIDYKVKLLSIVLLYLQQANQLNVTHLFIFRKIEASNFYTIIIKFLKFHFLKTFIWSLVMGMNPFGMKLLLSFWACAILRLETYWVE
jgi:hypothetical protein